MTGVTDMVSQLGGGADWRIGGGADSRNTERPRTLPHIQHLSLL